MTVPAAVAVVIQCLGVLQSPSTQSNAPASMSIENEVIANIVNQPIGSHAVADLNLPRPFLRRSADRIIRSSFEQRYRIVVDDAKPVSGQAASQPADANAAKRKSTRPWIIGTGMAGLVVILAALAARKRKQNRGLK
jgi:hypothetical protein